MKNLVIFVSFPVFLESFAVSFPLIQKKNLVIYFYRIIQGSLDVFKHDWYQEY